MTTLKKVLRLGQMKEAVKSAITKNRSTYPIRMAHSVARFIEQAYENEGSDFTRNGEKELLSKLSKANFDIIFDVGANVGKWSQTALENWPNAHVHAFEVAPNTFRDLQSAFPANSKRITLNNVGVSDTEETQTMYYFADAPELTCDMPRHDLTSVPFEAKMVRLDTYCAKNGIEKIDFLKIDVEGAEYRVLKGFSDFLDAGKVNCLQFEYGPFAIDTRHLLADYFATLSKSFWIGKIFPGGVPFQDYHWTMEDFKFCNYFCVSRSRPDLKALVERPQ
ncbi:FkbM family methyltransferase [Hyphomicrobium sp. MC8b]|uniref:FkbM family methyltransferase n=1 Tax=Hyphomicrobium sp. MC8b TaxID=300273 RepID=UPI00391BD401